MSGTQGRNAGIPGLVNRDGIIYDVVGIGNAIVDVIARVDDAFLERHGMAKGSMTLIDAPAALALTSGLVGAVCTSGGSGANTVAGISSLGGRAAFIGKVADDDFGDLFTAGMAEIGVRFHSETSDVGEPTARSVVLVTPDAQRTMNTHLGASTMLTVSTLDADLVSAAAVVYLEGYLFDRDEAKEAFRRAASVAHDSGRSIALTLSDSFCVERHREDFAALVRDEVDVLFANEDELKSLYGCGDFGGAVELLRRDCRLAAVTRSEKGCVVVTPDEVHEVPAVAGVEVVDTTGAGDLFAAGFLFGLTRGHDLLACARIGAIAAAEVISHLGPRPLVDLSGLLPADLR